MTNVNLINPTTRETKTFDFPLSLSEIFESRDFNQLESIDDVDYISDVVDLNELIKTVSQADIFSYYVYNSDCSLNELAAIIELYINRCGRIESFDDLMDALSGDDHLGFVSYLDSESFCDWYFEDYRCEAIPALVKECIDYDQLLEKISDDLDYDYFDFVDIADCFVHVSDFPGYQGDIETEWDYLKLILKKDISYLVMDNFHACGIVSNEESAKKFEDFGYQIKAGNTVDILDTVINGNYRDMDVVSWLKFYYEDNISEGI